MAPIWDPKEAESGVYKEVEKHSEGMISFTYRPPSQGDLDALKNSETYRVIQRQERDQARQSSVFINRNKA
jgi:hypothetical protein